MAAPTLRQLSDSSKVYVFGKVIKKLKLYWLKYRISSGRDSSKHRNIKYSQSKQYVTGNLFSEPHLRNLIITTL